MVYRRQSRRWLAIAASTIVLAGTATACARSTTPLSSGNAGPAAVSVASYAPSPAPSVSRAPVHRSITPAKSAHPKTTATTKPSTKPTSPAATVNLAAKLTTLPKSTDQVIIVHASTSATTYATLETYVRTTTGWVPKFAPMAARVGNDGLSDHHVEGTPNTPEGMFAFGPTIYGNSPDPGVKFAYHHLVTDDWWDENPSSSTYNTFEHVTTSPGGASEALWKLTNDYAYLAFIEYNVPAVGDLGSAVFLHVASSNPTAGCVSLPRADLVTVLTWLDPKKNPRIVISVDSELHNY